MEGYFSYLAFHAPMVEAILEVEPKRAVEVGCGGGNLSIFLSQVGVNALGLDIEAAVIEEAARHNRNLRGQAEFRVGDGFATGLQDQSYDIVHSQGVLEHFDDGQIERFLAEGIRIARRSVHSMPNINYPSRDFGNERLMREDFWAARCEAAGRLAGRAVTVRTLDYRRRFHKRHIINSLRNRLLNRCFFTLAVIDTA